MLAGEDVSGRVEKKPGVRANCRPGYRHRPRLPLREIRYKPIFSAARNADCGIFTLPNRRIRFLPYLLLLQQPVLAGYISTITFRRHVLAQRTDRFDAIARSAIAVCTAILNDCRGISSFSLPQMADRVKILHPRISVRHAPDQNPTMTHLAGHDRSQALLLSETLANYVSAENPVRFIAASVEGLDLAACGFACVQPKTIGRSGYAPSGLLKLSIYASMGVRAPVGRQLQGKVSKGSWAAVPAARCRLQMSVCSAMARASSTSMPR